MRGDVAERVFQGDRESLSTRRLTGCARSNLTEHHHANSARDPDRSDDSLLASKSPARSKARAPAPPEQLGKVYFPTSCSPAVKKQFDRALALLHSFWAKDAIEGFNAVLQQDPDCVIAYWGIAMAAAAESAHRAGAERQREQGRSDGTRSGQSDRCEDAARTRLSGRGRLDLPRCRQDRFPCPPARLRKGDGGAGATLSG